MKNSLIVTILIVAIILITAIGFALGRNSNIPAENVEEFSASFNPGFEEDQWQVIYRLTYLPADFAVKQQTPAVSKLSLTEGSKVHTVEFFYNGAAGFASPRELWNERSFCTDCKEKAVDISVPDMDNPLMFENATAEWLVYERQPGFVIIKMQKPSNDVRKVMATLKLEAKELGILEVPQVQVRKVKLYYVHKPTDDRLGGCTEDSILPVERTVVGSKTPVQDTIKLLLKGELTVNEKAEGYTTEYPLPGFELLGAKLVNGVLTLEFRDGERQTSGGSCRGGMLATQIMRTAKQFPEVKEVKFLPENELFQP